LHSAIGYCSPISKEQLAAAAWVVTPCPLSRGKVTVPPGPAEAGGGLEPADMAD
jgi:hypothetical protein